MKIKLSSIIGTVYLTLSLFMFAFINFNGATGFQAMTVPFIDGRVIVLHFFFTIVCIAGLLMLRVGRVKFDIICVLLAIKCVLDFIPAFYSSTNFENFFWHYVCTVVAFFSYFIMINHPNDCTNSKYAKIVFVIFGLILSLQVLYTAVYCGVGYLDLTYKAYMVIPYGGTNIISSGLVPIVCLVVNEKGSKKHKSWMLCLMIIAIILTKSRGGMLLCSACIFYFLYRGAKNRRSVYLKRGFLLVGSMLVLLALLSNETVLTVLGGFTDLSSGNLDLNALTSGRFGLFQEMFQAWASGNVLFGIGLEPQLGNLAGAHNIIIDLLLKCGLIGFGIYLGMFVILMRSGKKLANYRGSNSYFIMAVVIYINSLFEVCYFSYECDVILWMILGLMMSEYYEMKKDLTDCLMIER